jgi:uncharacterized protein (DUF952 family)
MENRILHITPAAQWQQAEQAGIYHCDSLDLEGFIHCSTPEQVIAVANRFFCRQTGLLLLCINPEHVQAELRYDAIETGERFPHIYGALNLDAVVQVLPFEPDASGNFTLPAAIDHV